MTYKEAVRYINDIPKFTKKTTLDHTRQLLRELGNPEKGQQIFHVAGTNGKGSTCAFLEAMLQKGGYRCGLFTSPHLERINERFRIGGENVSDQVFTGAFERVMAAAEVCMARGLVHPTYFETLFLMAMVIFAEAKLDFIILETGLGGRLDATNVVEDPLACIITSISRDHTEYLGETIPEIAGEKAGILKAGRPVIFDMSDPAAAAVIEARAKDLGCPCIGIRAELSEKPGIVRICRKEFSAVPALSARSEMNRVSESSKAQHHSTIKTGASAPEKDMFVSQADTVNTLPRRQIKGTAVEESYETVMNLPFAGEYQFQNAALAWTAMGILREVHGISGEECLRGLTQAVWPCRMEKIAEDVIVDGAHNEDGIAKFISGVQSIQKENSGSVQETGGAADGKRPLTLLFSAVADKRYREMISELAEGLKPERVIVTEFADARGASSSEMAELFRQEGIADARAVPDTEQACRSALQEKGDGLLCCVGSLYLAGKAAPILRRMVKEQGVRS